MSPPIIHHDINNLSNEAEDEDDTHNNHHRHDNNEDTGDFSSYWQSIPDPPMFDTGSTATAAASSSFETSSCTLSNNNNNNNNFAICQDDNIEDDSKDDDHPPTNSMQQSSVSTLSASTATEADYYLSNDHQKTATAKKRLRDVTNNQTQHASITTRKKKTRRSLLLPWDNNESSTADTADLKSLSCISSSQPDAVAATKVISSSAAAVAAVNTKFSSSRSDNNNRSNNDKHTQQRMIQLVREYCALPTTHNNHYRIHSQQAREIERLSCYPMPGTKFHIPIAHTETAVNDCDDDDANNTGERKGSSATTKTKVTLRQEFILHLKPIVQEMEHRKQTDMMESRSATRCEMHRNKGRCYYMDVGTGEEVDPREYERRYLRWIERRRVERLESNKRRREDDDDDFGKKCGQNDEELELPSPQLEEIEVEGGSDCNFDMDQSVDMDDSVLSSAASSVNDSMSEVDGARTNTVSAAQFIEPATTAAAATLTSTSSINDNNTGPSANDTNDNSFNSNSGSSILGLPSLPPSNDTRVIQARTELWRAIDVALETYSKEILAIQRGQKLDGDK